MKRVICLMMVVVMATVCCAAFADDSATTDEHLKELGMMKLYYMLAPDDFGPDYIMRTYLDLMLYMNTDAMEYFNVGYYLTREKEETAVDYVRRYAISVTNIVKVATDGYADWLNGKMNDKEYVEVLMMLVDGVIDSNQK